MQEMQLAFAIQQGLQHMKRSGTVFKPSIASLVTDFSQPNNSGVIALPPEKGLKNHHGYDLVKLSVPEVSELEASVGDLWECTKEHYGLTIAATVASIPGIPLDKISHGHEQLWGSSKNTNLVSHLGHKFYPRALLKNGSLAARVAKKTFGTVRIFGIIGRASPFVAVGLAVIDVISIGMCVYDKRNGK